MPYSSSFDLLSDGLMFDRLSGNVINSNMRGYTIIFDQNTPASVVAQSTAAYYQDRRRVPDIIEVIPGETGQADNTKTQEDRNFDQILDFYMNATPEQIEKAATELRKVDTVPQSKLCESLSDDNYFGIPFKTFCNSTAEASKRLGLFLIGGLLLIVGIKYFLMK